MNRLSKKCDFHIPFIKELVFVGFVTIVSMISMRVFLESMFPTHHITSSFTSSESQLNSNP
jgi:hypothetical protein